jgi:integrase
VVSKFFGRARRFGGGRLAEGVAATLEYRRFRAAKPVFVIALGTGLSQADLLALRWASVDLHEGWICVPRTKTKVEATIPLSKACREALAECRGRPVVSENVFLTEDGQPYSVSTINRYFRKAKELAGITRRFWFHDLRHSFASFLASRGVSIQVIAKALGHSSSTMAERYARPNEEAMKSILTALDSVRTETPARSEGLDRHRKNSNSFSNSSEDVGASRGV